MTKTKEKLNLAIFDAVGRSEKGDTLHLLHPFTGKPAYNGETPLTISMYGKDSNMSLDMIQDAVRRTVKANKAKKGNVDDEFDIRESIEEAAEKHAGLIFEWTGFEDDDGKILPCTHANVKAVLIKYKDIRTQVIKFFENEDGTNFTKG